MDEPKAVSSENVPKGFSYVQFHTPFVERMRTIDRDNRMKKLYKLKPYNYLDDCPAQYQGPRPAHTYRAARRTEWKRRIKASRAAHKAWIANAVNLPEASFVGAGAT